MRGQEFPIPTRLNLAIIAGQVGCFAALVYATSLSSQAWHLALLFLAFATLGNSIYAIVHEAEHGLLHPHRRINDMLGIALALLFPAPFHLIRQGHLGHHRRNRSDDEAFDYYFPGDWPWLKYLILYGILTGFYWALVVLANVLVLIVPFLFKRRFFEFDRPSAAFMEALNPRYFWLIQLEAILAIALHGLIVWGLAIPLWKYLLVYFGFGFTWSAMQYVHHFGTERDIINGARNLRLFRWLDALWLHHNLHLIHHRRPHVPWIYLPQVSAEHPADRDFLLWHYFRMWRGPRLTETRFTASSNASPTPVAELDV